MRKQRHGLREAIVLTFVVRSLFIALLAGTFSASAQGSEGFRAIPLQVLPGKPHFTSVHSSASGIDFTNVLALQRHLTNQILLNGSGVAAGDVNGDGLVDLYFCGLDSP